MKGRYGFDSLSQILLFIGCLCLLWKFTFITGIVFVGISVYRIFSKNIYKRKKEALIFENFIKLIFNKGKYNNYSNNNFILKIKNKFFQINKKINSKIYQIKNYKIVKCPKCGQKLRLPRKKGKIIVTCKKCLCEFNLKT